MNDGNLFTSGVGVGSCDTLNLSASLCDEVTERHREGGYNLVFSALSKLTSPRLSLCQDEGAPALGIANIITASFILNMRDKRKHKQCPFVERPFLPWLLSLGIQGPSVPTGYRETVLSMPRAPAQSCSFLGSSSSYRPVTFEEILIYLSAGKIQHCLTQADTSVSCVCFEVTAH